MNKIKLLYDVVTTMKNKELITGVLNAGVQKEQKNIFSLQKEFTKNLSTGHTQAKISTELDYEGKKLKHESNTEFTMPCHCHRRHFSFARHMHPHHAGRDCSVKGTLSKIAFAFGILNSLQTSEQENGTIVSLALKEIPEDMKEIIAQKIECAKAHLAHHSHDHHSFLKELLMLEAYDFTLTMQLNKNREIEDISAVLDGTQRDEQGQPTDLKMTASLRLFGETQKI